jgi:8-oxo-dGTP diphosphatase
MRAARVALCGERHNNWRPEEEIHSIMDRMDPALALDEKTGDALTAFLPAGDVSDVPAGAPMPAALIAVWCGPHVLLVFDRFRRQWELPGGRIDPGETPLQAAVRELHEESGLRLSELTLAGYAGFRLTRPPRSEYAAIYTGHTSTRRWHFVPNQEIGAIRWWDTTDPPPIDTQIIDATLALHTRPGG